MLLFDAAQDSSPRNGAAHFREGLPTSASLTRRVPHRQGQRLTGLDNSLRCAYRLHSKWFWAVPAVALDTSVLRLL